MNSIKSQMKNAVREAKQQASLDLLVQHVDSHRAVLDEIEIDIRRIKKAIVTIQRDLPRLLGDLSGDITSVRDTCANARRDIDVICAQLEERHRMQIEDNSPVTNVTQTSDNRRNTDFGGVTGDAQVGDKVDGDKKGD